MNYHLTSCLIDLHSIITIIIFVLILIPPYFCQEDDEPYQSCSRPYTCGSLQDIMYPFWGNGRPQFCGCEGFDLRCVDSNISIIKSGSQAFRVLNIKSTDNQAMPTDIVTVARADLFDNSESSCPPISLSGADLFYDCDDDISSESPNFFNCSTKEREIIGFYTVPNDRYWNTQFRNLSNLCKTATTRIAVSVAAFDRRLVPTRDLRGALEQGFDVQYNASNEPSCQCKLCRGICGSDRSNSGRFVCFYNDQHNYSQSCPPPTNPPTDNLRGVSTCSGVVGTIILISIIISICKSKNIKNDKELEAFLQQYGSLTPKRYTFSEVKKMTKSFKEKLGQGGFGQVYKGKLINSHLVHYKKYAYWGVNFQRELKLFDKN